MTPQEIDLAKIDETIRNLNSLTEVGNQIKDALTILHAEKRLRQRAIERAREDEA